MHCREFRSKHVAFVDDLLPAVEMQAMWRHLHACSGCARQDSQIRRSLLLVRNLRPIEASPEFMERLNSRLAAMGPVSREDVARSRSLFPSFTSAASIAMLAAGVVAIAYFAVETNSYFVQPSGSDLAARAVAVAQPMPMEPSASMTNAALVASVPTGIPVWPAVLMVGQTPMRFASMEFSEEGQAR